MFMEGTSDDAANIDAINRYITDTEAKTAAAKKAKDAWRKWHENLGWYDKNFPSLEVYDTARNLRNKFNEANAVTPAEYAAVKAVQQNGLSSEQLRGETDRRTSTGGYLQQEEKEPFFPLRIKIFAGVAAVGILAAAFAKKVYLDPFLPKR